MREKRMTALWEPYEWHVGCGLHLEAIYPIPSGVVVWVQIPQGRYLVQTALKQGQRYNRRRTWCANCGRYNGRLNREGQCQNCAAWWRANPLPVLSEAGTDDWEESTTCRSCYANVHPKRLGPGGYCHSCIEDAFLEDW